MYNLNHIRTAASALFITLAASAGAHTVVFSENFNNSYSENFPTVLELDHLPPLNNVRPLFTDNNGVAQPWWKLKDASASEDGFLASHSAYTTPSQSNDWIVSRPIEIPSEGFVLSFGAQSYVMRTGDRLSDLRVYITESPVDADNLPSEPALFVENVPEGKFKDIIEKDFTMYELSMDDYAGKTVYLSFANLNHDRDLLVIDDILIRRLDIAELNASADRYTAGAGYDVTGSFTATTDKALTNWTLTFDAGDGSNPQSVSGDVLEAGKSYDFSFKGTAIPDVTTSWELILSADGMPPIASKGLSTGLAFMPVHRVLLEESTGTWCGNCPLGMYAMEQMVHNEDLKDLVIPVSVHIAGGAPDNMVNEEYAFFFAVQSAPALRIDRDLKVSYFSNAHDGVPADINNPLSTAYAVMQRQRTTSLLGIGLDAKLIKSGDRYTSIECTTTLSPAITLPGDRYTIGYILTENNVCFDNPFWYQMNYFSGVQLESGLDGFTSMPETIHGWKFQDVARQAYGYRGYEGLVMPETLRMGEDFNYTTTLLIPDTYREIEDAEGNFIPMAPAIVAENLTLVAYIMDKEDSYRVVNAIACPLSENADKRMTIAEQCDALNAVEIIPSEPSDPNAPAEYFTLSGMRVVNPAPGLYIVRRGNSVTKEIIR